MQGSPVEYREKLIELVAETDDALMEKFFEEGSLSDEEIITGLKAQVRDRAVYPVLFSSGTGNIGVSSLLNAIVDIAPDPTYREKARGHGCRWRSDRTTHFRRCAVFSIRV